LTKERGQIGGWTGLAMLALLVLVFCAFHGGGAVVGSACAAVAVVAVFLVHGLETRRQAARLIRPNLMRFLSSQGVSLGELEKMLQGSQLRFPKLERHLACGAYDAMRMDSVGPSLVSDDVASLFFKPRKQAGWA
jgi:hypothetical protein